MSLKLNAFDWWMVKRNLEYAKHEGIELVVSRLRRRGYRKVADVVQSSYDAKSLAKQTEFLGDYAPTVAEAAMHPTAAVFGMATPKGDQ